MNHAWQVLALAALVTLGACSTDTTSTSPEDSAPVYRNGDVIPNEYIVVFRASSFDGKGQGAQAINPDARESAIRSHMADLAAQFNIPSGNIHHAISLIDGVTITLNDQQLDQLRKHPSVEFIEQDRIIGLPPMTFVLDGKSNSVQAGQSTPWGITKVGGASTPSSSSIRAWIVDTGIDLDHSDLNVNTSYDKSFVSGVKSADDGNGHGTHVAGTIGAKNNSYGVVGVAAGISLVPVKVLANNGSGRFSWSIDGFDYVRKKGSSGDVVNYSVGPGSRYTSTTLDKAVKNLAAAGFKVCLAAGNSADDATYYSPARVNETNVYTIASMDEYTVFSDFSNYGSCVDWIEPGEGVLSTYKNNKYATGSGTSMATPHATGILAAGGIESGGTVTSVPSNTTTDWGKRN